MPIYEYTCESCQTAFEHLQRSMSDGRRPACPQCRSQNTSKKLSVFAVASDSGKSSMLEQAPASCGRCGGAPGSCGM